MTLIADGRAGRGGGHARPDLPFARATHGAGDGRATGRAGSRAEPPDATARCGGR